MSRPKLVQEGKPLDGDSSKNHLPAMDDLQKKGSKYRLVIGGEDGKEQVDGQEHAPITTAPPATGHYRGYNNTSFRNNLYNNRSNSFRHNGYRGRGYNPRFHGGRNGYGNRSFRNSHHHHHHHHKSNGYYANPHHNQPVANGYHPQHQQDQQQEQQEHDKKSNIQTRLVIGGDDKDEVMKDDSDDSIIPQTYNEEHHHIERMEGVVSLDAKEPLVVMDGANVAYTYADAMAGNNQGSKREPDYRGMQVASEYFLKANVRVLIVLPAPWFRVKPNAKDHNKENALMLTERLEILHDLKKRGLLVAAPPRDDDDAYALTIARREADRALERGDGGGYVLSNDMFRDAMDRDEGLAEWLKGDRQGRISFAFCDMGSQNDFGDPLLDFIPNPRHILVAGLNGNNGQ